MNLLGASGDAWRGLRQGFFGVSLLIMGCESRLSNEQILNKFDFILLCYHTVSAMRSVLLQMWIEGRFEHT